MRQSRKTVQPSRDPPFWVDKLIGNLLFKFHAGAAQERKQFTRAKDTNPEQSGRYAAFPQNRVGLEVTCPPGALQERWSTSGLSPGSEGFDAQTGI